MEKFFRVPLSITMYPPKNDETEWQRVLVATVVRIADQASHESTMPGSRIVQRVRGYLQPVDWRKMVKELRAQDSPCSFISGTLRFRDSTL